MMYNESHVTIVLGHMLRDASFAATACRLEPNMFKHPTVGGTRSHVVLFYIVKKYYLKYTTLPDMSAITAEFKRLSTQSSSATVHSEFEQLCVDVVKVEAGSLPLAKEVIRHLADECMLRPGITQALSEATIHRSISGLQEKLNQLSLAQKMFDKPKAIDIVGDPIEEDGERCSTFIPWMDAMFGGGRGIVRGSTMGIISPQGGGKTTYGLWLGVSQALSGHAAHVVLVEEGMTRSMRCKIIGAAVGIPYGDIDSNLSKCGNNLLQTAIMCGKDLGISEELIRLKLSNLAKNLHVTDAVKEQSYGLKDFLQANDQLLEDGKDVRYMYIDWAGILATRLMHFKEYEKHNKESVLKSISYDVSAYAQRTNTIVAVSQQMGSTFAGKGAFARHDMYCAADCRGFTEPMKYVFCINQKDTNSDLSLFQVVKSRDDVPNQTRILHLQGQYPRIIDVSDRWEQQRRRFVKKSAGGHEHDIPSEER